MAVIPNRQLQILLFFLSILQYIVAAFGNGIDVLLIFELNQSLLRSILTAVITLCKLADRRNFLTSCQFSLFNILSNLINDALVFCLGYTTVPIQILFFHIVTYFKVFYNKKVETERDEWNDHDKAKENYFS